MASAYVTSGGGKWHQRSDCEALLGGQEDAAARGMRVHAIEQVEPASVGGRGPCGWCVRNPVEGPAAPPPVEKIKTETPVEQRFLDDILRPLPELSGWKVESQTTLRLSGQNYRPDFTLTSGKHRIAIEIDGEHKGPNQPSHDDSTRRQQSSRPSDGDCCASPTARCSTSRSTASASWPYSSQRCRSATATTASPASGPPPSSSYQLSLGATGQDPRWLAGWPSRSSSPSSWC